ncbi:hypothetical protein GCM10010264_40790 [Streptomyces globisporus]|nr:hypothetical protein GCM10010264_40790 [Streptomyces globisporus]
MTTSSLDAKYRKKVRFDTPAAATISSMVTASNPFWASSLSAAQASRQGFAAITVGSTLFAAVIGVWSVVLMRRGRHGEARPGEPGRTVEDAQDTAGTAPR